jgi:hypothetical protein
MKKLLVAVLALASVSAFANHKNLVTFDGDMLAHYANYILKQEVNPKGGGTATETSGYDLMVNYAWSVHSNVYVGGIFGYAKEKVETGSTINSDTKTTTYGVRAIYDFSSDHANSMYAGLSYVIENEKDSTNNSKEQTKFTTISFGKRYGNFATLAGVNVTYSPSIDYTMLGFGKDSAQTLDDGTVIKLNVVKFDVLF